MNNYHQYLRTRQSVRRFEARPVSRETLEQILETATHAPSAHNRQPWRFAVLTTDEAKNRLAEAMGAEFRRDLAADGLPPEEVEAQVNRSEARIRQAPVSVLLCMDPTVGDEYPDPARRQAELTMAMQSTAMAGYALLLAAYAEGLGGVWMCAPLFAPDAARRALDLPAAWQPQGLILLGYPAKIPRPRGRRPFGEVTLFF